MLEVVGWFGSMLLSFSSVPQILKVIKNKSSLNISWWMLTQWFVGLLCVITFGITNHVPLPILGGYFLNLTLVSILVFCCIKYRKV